MKIVGVIPARGGSKRVLNKNLKLFCGKPLIAWAILTANNSKALDRVIVTTDNPAIAKVAKEYGAEVPFMRPQELAGDTGGIEPTVQHTYQWLLDNEGYQADCLALLLTTNPLRQTFHINEAFNLFHQSKSDSVVSVNETPANHTPYWTLTKSDTGEVRLFGEVNLKDILDRRQDFPQKCYARNDIIYILKPQNLFETPSRLYGNKVELYETSSLYEIDINTPEDWIVAEVRFKQLKNLGPIN